MFALKAFGCVVDEVEKVVCGLGALVLCGFDCCLVVESDGGLTEGAGERVEKVNCEKNTY